VIVAIVSLLAEPGRTRAVAGDAFANCAELAAIASVRDRRRR
jgi:hypothetical protein